MANIDDLDFKFKEVADDRVLSTLDKIGQALAVIYNSIKGFKVNFPKVFKVEGSVDIDSISDMPPVEVKNLKDIAPYFNSLEERIRNLAVAISTAKGAKIDFPKMEFPKIDNSAIVEELKNVQEELKAVGGKQVKFPKTISVDNFPIQLTPQPVTNININGLRGPVLSTAITITTTATALPTTPLSNRRSMIIFNNSAQTVYLGGSSVTTANGLPVLTQTYSPAMDLSAIVTLYGIVAGTTADVRVIEASTDATGS